MKQARGYFASRSVRFRSAKETLMRAGNYARAGRRQKKGDFRALWITRLTAACLSQGITYSRLMQGLKAAGIVLNRKMLSEVAVHDPAGFAAVAAEAKAAGAAG